MTWLGVFAAARALIGLAGDLRKVVCRIRTRPDKKMWVRRDGGFLSQGVLSDIQMHGWANDPATGKVLRSDDLIKVKPGK